MTSRQNKPPEAGALRVNFHCHSTKSDGAVSPRNIAASLAEAGAEYAALTDHDTTSGLADFAEALGLHGIGFLTGVEITVGDPGDAVHILAYGFDPENPALQRLLALNRHYRTQTQTIFGADVERIRGWFKNLFKRLKTSPLDEVLPSAAEIIRVVHRAGGLAFLAHPLTISNDPHRLDKWLGALKKQGLDGIEAVYTGYNDEQRQMLLRLAERHELLVSAGTDFHAFDREGLRHISIDMPSELWSPFSAALGIGSPASTGEKAHAAANGAMRQPMPPIRQVGRKRRFALRIVLPTVLATALFILTIYSIILPAMEDALLQRKREMIRELTYSAWSVLASYEADAERGMIGEEEAQIRAVERLSEMRYGAEQKDYFWVTDMQPVMIMHPYRSDLNGTDVSDFRDLKGTAMFVEFAAIARDQGEGYVDYYWQWKDNPDRVVPKESFVKRFEPWDWVLGTGIYLDDVNDEIAALTGRLNRLSLSISACIVLLLGWITWESLKIESQRNRAEFSLRESHERNSALVAAATEGTLMVLDGRCAYANRAMSEMLGWGEEGLPELELNELLAGRGESLGQTQARIEAIIEGEPAPAKFEGRLVRKDGEQINAMLSVTRIAFAGKTGVIIVARDLSGRRLLEAELTQSRTQLQTLTEKLNIGVFRATGGADPLIEDVNPAAWRIFGLPTDESPKGTPLLDLISDEEEREAIRRRLEAGQGLKNHIIRHLTPDGSGAVLSLSLQPVVDQSGTKNYNGEIEDVTARRRTEEERDNLLQEFQSSVLFLNEPLSNIPGSLLTCEMNTPIELAIKTMSRHDSSCLAVTSGESGEVIGVLTDCDIRDRVVANGVDTSQPVFTVMSSPVVAIPDSAPVYEAILAMHLKEVGHLAVRDEAGRIVRMVRSAELMQFHQYSSAVITSEILRADSVEEIAAARDRLPRLVKTLLDSGVRPRNVNRMMTRMADNIVERLLELAIEELGPAPCRFCYMALGSEGRGEQTLVTDQDSALVFEDLSGDELKAAGSYFERLAEMMSGWMNSVGYEYCKGGVMLSNPKWRKSFSQWQNYFKGWITGSTPEDLLRFNIFFDFRPVGGDRELMDRLRETAFSLIEDNPPFLLHFAQNALLYKPPIGLRGKLVTAGSGEKANTIDLKDAMLSIVNFARLYSLKHRLPESNTLDRLDRLYELHALRKSFHEELSEAYSMLMELRLSHQADELMAGRTPDNYIDPKSLNQMQETMLRQAFSLLSVVRKKISHDFLGMA